MMTTLLVAQLHDYHGGTRSNTEDARNKLRTLLLPLNVPAHESIGDDGIRVPLRESGELGAPVNEDILTATDTLRLPLRDLVEPGLPSHSWFAGDADCAQFETRFARPGSLPDTRLASFPRSGNTWTRYLLEAATGFVTCGVEKTDDGEKLPPPTSALPQRWNRC